jgi:hypothetical protein
MNALTPHSFKARLDQITGKGHQEYEFEHDGLLWWAFFEVTHEQLVSDEFMRWHDPVEAVRLVGAWAESEDGGAFCGNRFEVQAIVGQQEIERWEQHVFDAEDGE